MVGVVGAQTSGDPEEKQRRHGFLSTAPASGAEHRLALAILLLSVLAFAAAMPFARIPMPALPAFIPSYESALAINDLITSVLLFGQYNRLGSRALLVLACGYLFDALIILPHLLTFPGVFSATGLLGAGDQTTAWLYVFWHGGFPLFVLGYALLADRPAVPPDGARRAILPAIAATVAAVSVLTLTTTVGHDLLPVVVEHGDYSALVSKGVSPTIWSLSLIALLALWRRRKSAVLDLWLMVVMGVWLLDVALSAVVGASRYDLGWYAGRSYGLLASGFVLVVLLIDMNRLYGHLGKALAVAETRNLELLRSREDLARAQRLEVVGQLTGGVAHDFNNLLTIITGNLDMILRAPGDAPRVERLAGGAMKATARGARLTHQLLTFARRQVNRPEVVNPNRLVTDFEELLRRATGTTAEIVTRLSPSVDPIRLDPSQFEAAILNLVMNARDAMAGGGRITIETRNVALDAGAAAQIPELAPGHYVLVAVSDTGAGMPPEVVAKAFEPFFTTKEIGKGSGLGLSQVYGFVKSAGGHVTIDSTLGIGTTVRLYLPKSVDRAKATDQRADVVPVRVASAHEAILVVEDDEEVLAVAVDGLTEHGYHVLTAVNAAQALDILRGDQRIDLLFSDIIMPGGMNGAQLAVEARRIRPSLKILLTSGYTASALVQDHGIPDDLEVLGKPYRREDLTNKLRLVING